MAYHARRGLMRLLANQTVQLILFLVATLCATGILVAAELNDAATQGSSKPTQSHPVRYR